MIFSYLNYFIAVCQFEAAHLTKDNQYILTKSAESQCIIMHTDCMIKKLKFNIGWTMQDMQLKAAKCAVELRDQ